jgi:hypothetical protein
MSERITLDRFQRDLHWVSVFLRGAIGSLLLSAGITKLPGGVAGTVGFYTTLFEQSLLPRFLVQAHASVILFAELLLGAWLLSGYHLGIAWRASALVLTSLAIGMLFAGKYDTASDNYVYVFLALVGLVTSHFDRWSWGTAAAAKSEGTQLPGHARAVELR